MQKLILITDDEAAMTRVMKRLIVAMLKKTEASGAIREIHTEDGTNATVSAHQWLLAELSRALDKNEEVGLLLITDCEIGSPTDGPDFIAKVGALQGGISHFKNFTALLMSGDPARNRKYAAEPGAFLEKPLTDEGMDLLRATVEAFVKS